MDEETPQRRHCLTAQLQEIEKEMQQELRKKMSDEEYKNYLRERAEAMTQAIMPKRKP